MFVGSTEKPRKCCQSAVAMPATERLDARGAHIADIGFSRSGSGSGLQEVARRSAGVHASTVFFGVDLSVD
jgi:hypothetical protein